MNIIHIPKNDMNLLLSSGNLCWDQSKNIWAWWHYSKAQATLKQDNNGLILESKLYLSLQVWE